ncbi:MAG: hypothetical protein OEV30_07980 [Ignavibacteria bacterium]|nr:hypothetical protein [Ignavibacteria bacterium]
MNANGRYPRAIAVGEREMLLFVLPLDARGYREYREDIQAMSVIAQGRRGAGHLILGAPPLEADHDSPLTPVFAFGMINNEDAAWSVTVREKLDAQIDVELMSGPPVPSGSGRSWTYSSWKPGQPSPSSGQPVREVTLTETDILVIAAADRRIWLHHTRLLTNRLIPVTGLHGELMMIEREKDPSVALNPASFFESLDRHNDGSLRDAFSAYNRIHPKIVLPADPPPKRRSRWGRFVSTIMRSGSQS